MTDLRGSIFAAVAVIGVSVVPAGVQAGSDDANLIVDAIANDPAAFEAYCAGDTNSMSQQIMNVTVELATKGRISGDFQALGSEAATTLGRMCAS